VCWQSQRGCVRTGRETVQLRRLRTAGKYGKNSEQASQLQRLSPSQPTPGHAMVRGAIPLRRPLIVSNWEGYPPCRQQLEQLLSRGARSVLKWLRSFLALITFFFLLQTAMCDGCRSHIDSTFVTDAC